MKLYTVLSLLFCILSLPDYSFSADLESLAKEGFTLVEEARVVGDYQGCIANTYLRFTNGKVFLCSSFGYDNSQYMPTVQIFKNKAGNFMILINGKAYSGSFKDSQ